MIKKDDLQALFLDNLSDLLVISNNIVKDLDVAEEICQESFIKLYNRPVPFLAKEDVKFWLIRVVKNLSINFYRKKQIEKKNLSNINFSDRYEAADTELVKKITIETVRNSIESLPDIYKEVVILKEYKDYSYKEIAKILNISESNVKIRIFRAREMLYNILYEEYYNERLE